MTYRNLTREGESFLDNIQHDYGRMNNELPQELWDIPVLSIRAIRWGFVNKGRFVGVIPATVSEGEVVAEGRVVIDADSRQMLIRRIAFLHETYPNVPIQPMFVSFKN